MNLYDGTAYATPAMADAGVLPLHIVYEAEIIPAPGDPVPATIQAGINAQRDRFINQPWVIDVERWKVCDVTATSVALNTANLAKYSAVMDAVKPLLSPCQPIGMYGVVPPESGVWSVMTGATTQKRYSDTFALDNHPDIAALAAKCDFVTTDVYVPHPDLSSMGLWAIAASRRIQRAKKYGKPVYVFICPQFYRWDGSTNTRLMTGSEWKTVLDTASSADAAVIWMPYGSVWNDAAEWWDATTLASNL